MKKYDEQKECISAEIKPNIQNLENKEQNSQSLLGQVIESVPIACHSSFAG